MRLAQRVVFLTQFSLVGAKDRTATVLLTPWCRVLLEKLTDLQLVKKFPAFYGTRRFITALTSVRHLPLSWASPIQSTYPHPTSWRSIVILSTHLRLGLPSGLFPSGFPTKNLYTPLSSPNYHSLQYKNVYRLLRVLSSRLLFLSVLRPFGLWCFISIFHLVYVSSCSTSSPPSVRYSVSGYRYYL